MPIKPAIRMERYKWANLVGLHTTKLSIINATFECYIAAVSKELPTSTISRTCMQEIHSKEFTEDANQSHH